MSPGPATFRIQNCDNAFAVRSHVIIRRTAPGRHSHAGPLNGGFRQKRITFQRDRGVHDVIVERPEKQARARPVPSRSPAAVNRHSPGKSLHTTVRRELRDVDLVPTGFIGKISEFLILNTTPLPSGTAEGGLASPWHHGRLYELMG